MEKGEESVETTGDSLITRKKREHVKKLTDGPPGWSAAKTVMKSSISKEEEESYVKRKGEGYKLKNAKVPSTVGLYEFYISGKDSKGENFKIPVYLGKAGEVDGEVKATLKSRFNTYARSGSHKEDIFNAILWGGYNIDHRYVTVSTRGDEKDTLIRNKEWETKVLDNVDYALNISENGKTRYNDIYLPYKDKEGYINLDKLYKSYLEHLKEPSTHSKDLVKILEKEIPEKVTKEVTVTSSIPKKKTYFSKKPASTRTKEKKLKEPVKKDVKEKTADSHLKKDGTLDKRFKENKTSKSVTKITSEPTVHLKADGTADKRFKENKETSIFDSIVKIVEDIVHTKSDGTLDMRYKENKSASITYDEPVVHTKSDGTLDMRYTENKTSYTPPTTSYESDYSSSSSYGSVGSSYTDNYSDYAWDRTGSYGGWDDVVLCLDGSPDMRYSSNQDLFG